MEKEKTARQAPSQEGRGYDAANHQVVLVGAVVDSDMRYLDSGTPLLRLQLAGESGEPRKVFYLSVRWFGKGAEAAADTLAPGAGAVVVARLSTWRREGGDELTLVAQRVELFPLREEDLAEPDAKGKRRMRGGTSHAWAVGNLARVDFGYSPTGTPYARGSVAVQDGEEAHFLPFVAFREAAIALEGAEKGQRVYLEGALLHDAWTDKEGKSRYGVRLEVTRAIPLLRRPKRDEERPEEERKLTRADLPF